MEGGPQPAVAVVVAAYQAERFLAAGLASVLEQLLPGDEVVVVDDGSTDRTWSIAAAIGPPVQVIRLPHNQGVGHALNVGIAATSAPVLCFLDADDYWAPGKMRAQRLVLEHEPDVEAVIGRTADFTDPECTLTLADVVALGGRGTAGVHKTGMAIRRSAWERIGGFDPAYRHADLIEWWPRATATGLRVHRLDRVVHYRRQHGHNIGARLRDEQRLQYSDVMRTIARRRREGSGT